MKTILKIIVTLILLISTCSTLYGGTAPSIFDESTIQRKLDIMNQQLQHKFSYPANYNYFKQKGDYDRNLNTTLLEGTDPKKMHVVYYEEGQKNGFGDAITWKGETFLRYIGYTKEGGLYGTPGFPWDAGWSGTRIEKMNFVAEPWFDDKTEDKARENIFCQNDLLEQNIINGLNHVYANTTAKELVPPNVLNSSLKDEIVYTQDASPTKGGQWVDYVYVMQPPTYDTWGKGVAWHTSGGNTYYVGIPIAPDSFNKNDIILSNLINNKEMIEPGKEYRCTVDVTHLFDEDLHDVDLRFYIDNIEVEKRNIIVKKSGTKESFIYKVPENYDKEKMNISIRVNKDQVIEEKNITNNIVSKDLIVMNENVNFAITGIKYDKYPANARVSAVVEVYNLSTVYVENIPVYFRISSGGNTSALTKYVSLVPGVKCSVVFNFTTPDQNAILNMYAEVNRDNTIEEIDKSNNSMSKQATVIKNVIGNDCQPTRSWTEWDRRWEEVGTDETDSAIYGWVYYQFYYAANINSTHTITPQTLKAGYGFEVSVTSTVNYWQTGGKWTRSPSNPPSAPTRVEVQADWDYTVYTMETSSVSANGLTATFRLPINPRSKLDARKIYTNKDLAGTASHPKSYAVQIHVCDSYTPSGKLGNKMNTYININGDMYEDDRTY
jgi:hypothetical protein